MNAIKVKTCSEFYMVKSIFRIHAAFLWVVRHPLFVLHLGPLISTLHTIFDRNAMQCVPFILIPTFLPII